MDSSITAAGRALRAGDPLGALKRVACLARRSSEPSFPTVAMTGSQARLRTLPSCIIARWLP